MLTIFYESVACWGSRLRYADASRFNKLISQASNVVRVKLDSPRVVVRELDAIRDKDNH